MNGLYPQAWYSYIDVLLIFLRAMGLFLLIPGFSHTAIPNTFKILFSMALSLVLYPILKPDLIPLTNSLSGLLGAAIRETAIGFLMGFIAYMVVEGTHLAAQLVGYQMGFGTAGLLEPQSQSSVSVIVHLQTWLVLVLFFVTDMHHHVLHIFVQSFSVSKQLNVPLSVTPEMFKIVANVSAHIFSLAIQLAAPFTVIILLCNVMIAILARMMPQMNILLFSFPITIMAGLFVFYLIAPEMISYIENVLGSISTDMIAVIKTI